MIKAVAEITELSFKEAMELLEEVPVDIMIEMTKEEAYHIKASLEELGAEVTIK